MEIEHLYLFEKSGNKPNIVLDIEDNILTLKLSGLLIKPQKVIIDTDVLPINSTTCISYNPQKNQLFPIYHYRELVRALNSTSMGIWKEINCSNYIQIDKKPDSSLFMKIFLSNNQDIPKSSTIDFGNTPRYLCEPSHIHEVDRKYQHQWRFTSIKQEHGIVDISVTLIKRWNEPVYLCHGGAIKEIAEGYNHVIFKHVPTANIQILVGDKTFTNWKFEVS